MMILKLCQNCEHRIILTDEQGKIAHNFCELDLPQFNKTKPVDCSSYNEKRN